MNQHEEELQRKIEQGELPGDDIDAKAYQHVFTSLRKPPDYHIHPSFADRVIQKVLSQQQQKVSSKDYWWLGAGFFLLFIVMIVVLVIVFSYIGFRFNMGFLNSISPYKGLFFTGLILIVLFNWLDKRWIRQKQSF